MTKPSAAVIDDPAAPFIKASQPTLIKVDVPESVVDRFEANVFLDEGMAHRDALMPPANAAVATHPADFKVTRIIRRAESRWERTRGRTVHGPWGLLV